MLRYSTTIANDGSFKIKIIYSLVRNSVLKVISTNFLGIT